MKNKFEPIKRKKIIVTGASGIIASFILPELVKSDLYDVVGLIRDDQKKGIIKTPGVLYKKASLLNFDEVTKVISGAFAIIHLAYDHVPGLYRGGEGGDLRGWYQRNMQMNLNLALAAEKEKIDTFIFLSSRAVYDGITPESKEKISETRVIQPNSHYGSLKAATEMMLCGFQSIRHTSIRCTGVYGIINPISFSKWYDLIREIHLSKILHSDRVSSEVHGEDLSRIISLLLKEDSSLPRVVNVSDLLVSKAMIADRYSLVTGSPIEIKERLTMQMRGEMSCEWLIKRGFIFSGIDKFNVTVDHVISRLDVDEKF